MNLSVVLFVMSGACALIATIAIIAVQRRESARASSAQQANAHVAAAASKPANALGHFGARAKK
jgi:hypothetical protein